MPALQPDYRKSAFDIVIRIASAPDVQRLIDSQAFCSWLQLLNITTHDRSLPPYLSGSLRIVARARRTSKLSFQFYCRLDKFHRSCAKRELVRLSGTYRDEAGELQIVDSALEKDDTGLAPRAKLDVRVGPVSTALNDICEKLLRSDAVTNGYGWADTFDDSLMKFLALSEQ